MSSSQETINALADEAKKAKELAEQTLKNAGNALSDEAKKAKKLAEKALSSEEVKKAEQALKNAGNAVADGAKKATNALDKSLKNIINTATTNLNETSNNVNLSSCLHKTSLFVSVIISLFAAKFYNVVDEKFILNFIFFFVILYITYNSILKMIL